MFQTKGTCLDLLLRVPIRAPVRVEDHVSLRDGSCPGLCGNYVVQSKFLVHQGLSSLAKLPISLLRKHNVQLFTIMSVSTRFVPFPRSPESIVPGVSGTFSFVNLTSDLPSSFLGTSLERPSPLQSYLPKVYLPKSRNREKCRPRYCRCTHVRHQGRWTG